MLSTSGREAERVGYLKPAVVSTIKIVYAVTSSKPSHLKGDRYENKSNFLSRRVSSVRRSRAQRRQRPGSCEIFRGKRPSRHEQSAGKRRGGSRGQVGAGAGDEWGRVSH